MKSKIAACLALVSFLLVSVSFAQVKHASHGAAGSGAAMARGKAIYNNICIACHMADGGGVTHMNPPLIKTSYVLGDKTTLIKIVLNGFKEDVEIEGQTYSNVMTPHADLKDQQIADVLTFVRKSFGNKASAITPAEVKKVRATNVVPKA
jgi:mono/diheme cytochrome c family protein